MDLRAAASLGTTGRPDRRDPALVRGVAAALLAAFSLFVVLHLQIGPVIATITPEHGIHTGDSIGVVAGAAAVFLHTARSWGSAPADR